MWSWLCVGNVDLFAAGQHHDEAGAGAAAQPDRLVFKFTKDLRRLCNLQAMSAFAQRDINMTKLESRLLCSQIVLQSHFNSTEEYLHIQAMSAFALRDINMTKLESRPLRSSPILYEMDNGRRSYNYVFFIDFIGSTAEVRAAYPFSPSRFRQTDNGIYAAYLGGRNYDYLFSVDFIGSTADSAPVFF